MAGEGKTTIATSIASQLDDEGILGACFFFSRDIDDRSRPDKVFSTIAYQLAHRHPYIANAVSNELEIRPDAGRSSVANQVHKLIQLPSLNFMMHLDPETPVIVVLDALDECGTEKDRKDLLEGLAAFTNLPPMLKVFLSSRPEKDIRTTFDDLGIMVQRCDLSSGFAMRTVNQDVSRFLKEKTDNIVRLYPGTCGSEAWPGEEKFRLLVLRAGSLFIWASTAMKFIEDEEVGDPMEQLDILLGEFPPLPESPSAVLDRLYLSVLQRAYTAKASTRRLDLFQKVLGAILTIRNPLPPSTLGDLLFPNDPSERSCGYILETVAKLGSVLFLPDRQQEHSQPIRTIHPSFAEFLTNEERSGTFSIDPLKSHADIVLDCLTTLLLPKSKVSCCGALLYGCRNWCHHLSYILDDGKDKFRDPKFYGSLLTLLGNLVTQLSASTPKMVHWLVFLREVRDDLDLLISQLKVIIVFRCFANNHNLSRPI